MNAAPANGLYVETRGSGPPLLMVHGWPFDHRVFAPQIEDLAVDHRVIAFDRRGFGRSPGAPSLAADVKDIAALLDAQGTESAHILGMSQGGRVALRFAAENPSRARSLLLQAPAVDGFTPAADPESIPLGEYAAWAEQGDMQRVREAWLRHPMVASGIDSAETIGFLRRLLADYSGADLADYDSRNPPFTIDVAAAIGAARIPVLILTGALETRARREHADHLLSTIPGATETIFENSGHMSNLTEPRAYNRAVRRFCAQVERERHELLMCSHD